MFKVSNKTFGVNAMRDLVAAVAGPREWGGRDRWFDKAARIAGLSYRQVRGVYYGEITDPENIAIRKLKEAAGKHEAQRLAEQFEHLAASLAHRDADFHSPDIDALVGAARALRGFDRTRINRKGD